MMGQHFGLPQRWLTRWVYGVIGCLLVLGLGLWGAWPAPAQSVNRATVSEILDGNQVFIQNQQARVNSVATQRQQVRTGAARASLTFNTGAVARLARNSSLTVGNCAQLQRGEVLVNGALSGCTGSTVAGVRGTLYTLAVDEAGKETIQVFEGTVEVKPLTNEMDAAPNQAKEKSRGVGQQSWDGLQSGFDDRAIAQSESEPQPVDITQEPIVVKEGESLSYDPATQQGFLAQLTPEDFERLLTGPFISDFTTELPGIGDLQAAFERLFPGLPFPGLSLPVPSLPIPSFPF